MIMELKVLWLRSEMVVMIIELRSVGFLMESIRDDDFGIN